jgi:hypothetical protein
MYAFSEIKQVHLEVTERCNAACPQCPRRIDGGAMNPKVTGAELSLGEIRRIMPVEFVRQLSKRFISAATMATRRLVPTHSKLSATCATLRRGCALASIRTAASETKTGGATLRGQSVKTVMPGLLSTGSKTQTISTGATPTG